MAGQGPFLGFDRSGRRVALSEQGAVGLLVFSMQMIVMDVP